MRMTCPTGGDAVISLAGEWLARRGRSAKDIASPPSRPAKDEAPGTGYGDPASMFNAMITPFDDLKVKGAIWYQGESNAGSIEDAEAYRTLLPLTIRSWRGAFEEPDMPFGIVSLAAYQPFHPEKPLHGIWPILRDSQLATERNSPNTGVITTIDVGDAGDIHPRDKRSVGERLARWAIAVAYGKQDVAWRGPRTKSARRDADGIVIDFDAERGRLATRDGKEPMGFAVAGADGVFHQADAMLLPPTGIKVRSAEVAEPVEIRYAWQDNPASSNLIDEQSKLPAHPFRIRVEADPVQTVPGAKPAK
jgi:sialate O-acetylesterase